MVVHHMRWVENVNASSTIELIRRHPIRELEEERRNVVGLERCTSRQVVRPYGESHV